MPRISSGVCGCSSWSEGGVGDGGFSTESGVAARLRVERRLLVPARSGLWSRVVDLVWGWCLQGRIPPVVLQW